MKLNAFQKTAITTVAATLFLILVGGLVRAAGAGLGCPDWPKCFGMWIPPTTLADLPAGFDESQFNVWKTWIEYVNRLVGVVIGLLITATFLLSIRYRKEKPTVFYSSIAAFVLVLFQGWLGGVVVRTGLHEGLITAHMLVAMVIVTVLLYATFEATSDMFKIRIEEGFRKKLLWTVWVLFGLTMIQLVLGTQVREAIDVIKNAPVVPPRGTWLENMEGVFPIHRSFSWLLVVAAGWLFYLMKKHNAEGWVKKLGDLNVVLVFLQVLIGIGLNYLAMPRVLQVLHLVGVAVMVCTQFLMILVLRRGEVMTNDQGQMTND